MSKVNLHMEGAVARVELNRPEKHNGMDFEMIDALLRIARQLRRDRDLRAVIIHGAGPSFCAGMDIKSAMSSPRKVTGAVLSLLKPAANRFQRVSLCWRDLSVPVVAAVEGNCFGAGVQLALGADIRIASPSARFSVMESKWGLVPDMGGTVLLREILPKDIALDLTFSARVLDAEQACALGLVTRIDAAPLAAASALADEIMQRSPDAIAATKHLFNEAWSADESTALAAERRWQLRMLRSPNQRIATKRNRGAAGEAYERRKW